jgi:hypothetical protein
MLHNEELYNYCSFSDIIAINRSTRIKWASRAERTVKRGKHISFAKREGRRLLVRSAFSLERTLKMWHRETRSEAMD